MKRFTQYLPLTATYAFLYLPILIMIIYSFNNATFSALWHGATLKWYAALFKDQALLSLTLNSIKLAMSAATLAVMIGALGAVALFTYSFWNRPLCYGLTFVLIVSPDLVLGVSLLVLYALLHFPLGFMTLLLAHITFCLPFVIVTLLGRLQGIDNNIFEAARDLGATDFTIFYRIILPLMMPALISSWLLSLTLSMDDVIISFFVSGASFQILPLYIYAQVRTGVTPEINALSTLIFISTTLLVLTSQLFLRKKP